MEVGVVGEKVVQSFKENGFVIIPGFLSQEEIEDLKKATKEVIEQHCENSPVSIFRDQSRNTYFAESGDKIRGFYEEGAIDKLNDGLNKVGHALHKFHPTFRNLTLGAKIEQVVREVTEIKEPQVIQSMVIFKHPRVGGAVIPHQDASYLFTDPTPGALLGFWIALDEASTENGCLHFFPGSHKEKKVYQRFIRNPDKSSDTLFIYTGESVPKLPNDTLVSAPCKPGDLVLIDGLVIHQSEPNTSEKPRMAYTFHVIDGTVNYSSQNWLQPTSENTFVKFKDALVK